jgi:MoxR-like ATPase
MTRGETDIAKLNEAVREEAPLVQAAMDEVRKVIVGQKSLIERMMVALLCRGHLLVEGVPGLAKTLAVKTMGQVMDLAFARIQFTPDLLPADLVGTMIYHQKTGEFVARKGPVFTNLLLADEINRAPAKVQSALLESMQERQVTLGETSHPLPEPFLVFATQNPIEQEGTYPLPEAQVDRFLMKLRITYPSREEERQILDRMATTAELPRVKPVIGPADIAAARRLVDQIYVDDKIKEYIVDVVFATRDPAAAKLDLAPLIEYGASPRATIALTLAAKAHAFLEGRGYVTPQDVKTIGPDVLRHRVVVTYEAEAEDVDADEVVRRVFDGVPVP